MAQLDVYRARDESGFLLDCQSDLLRHLSTRFVVPLLPPDIAPTPGERLNPIFQIDGKPVVMVTQFASSMEARHFGEWVASLADDHIKVIGALDMLITG